MGKVNPHAGHRDRLRNQALTQGVDSLHEHQVLELYLSSIVPYKDTNVMAHDLLNKFGSFANVFEADVEALKTVKGIGDSIAKNISLQMDIARYYYRSRERRNVRLNNYSMSARYFREIFGRSEVEEVYIVGLDSENRVVKNDCISKGDYASANVDIAKITEFLNRHKLKKFLIGHNHPEGKAYPSTADDKITMAMYVTSMMSGFQMLDHIIIGKEDSYSYKDASKLDQYRHDCLELINKQDAILKSEIQGKFAQGEASDESICEE